MDTIRAVCTQCWDTFVEYFIVIFEGMNQVVSDPILTRRLAYFVLPS